MERMPGPLAIRLQADLSTRGDGMKRACCSKFHSGDRVFGEKAPFEDPETSHGICPACMDKELEDIDRQIRESTRRGGD